MAGSLHDRYVSLPRIFAFVFVIHLVRLLIPSRSVAVIMIALLSYLLLFLLTLFYVFNSPLIFLLPSYLLCSLFLFLFLYTIHRESCHSYSHKQYMYVKNIDIMPLPYYLERNIHIKIYYFRMVIGT